VAIADGLLRKYARRGDELDLTEGVSVDRATMESWPADRQVPATAIRDLLRGASEVDPRGVRLRGAHVVGQLDLEGVSSDVILELRDCYLPAAWSRGMPPSACCAWTAAGWSGRSPPRGWSRRCLR
jgi:hypothetical protein